jgi:hypothetical protein
MSRGSSCDAQGVHVLDIVTHTVQTSVIGEGALPDFANCPFKYDLSRWVTKVCS